VHTCTDVPAIHFVRAVYCEGTEVICFLTFLTPLLLGHTLATLGTELLWKAKPQFCAPLSQRWQGVSGWGGGDVANEQGVNALHGSGSPYASGSFSPEVFRYRYSLWAKDLVAIGRIKRRTVKRLEIWYEEKESCLLWWRLKRKPDLSI